MFIIIKYFNILLKRRRENKIESENKDELIQNNINQHNKQQKQPDIEIFSCFNCGHPYKAYPPDSSFNFAYISPCSETQNLEDNHNHRQPYECVNCTHRNYLYWCQGHSFTYE